MVSLIDPLKRLFGLLGLTEENTAAVSIRRRSQPLLLNNVENFAEGFRCKAFQNTAGGGIEAERPAAMQNFLVNGLLES